MTAAPDAVPALVQLTLGSGPGRWALLATILGSAIAGIDATVVNVALPAIGADLDAGFTSLHGRCRPTRSPSPRSSCSVARSATGSTDAGSSWPAWSGSRRRPCCAGWR